jgi:hypothetical protein
MTDNERDSFTKNQTEKIKQKLDLNKSRTKEKPRKTTTNTLTRIVPSTNVFIASVAREAGRLSRFISRSRSDDS